MKMRHMLLGRATITVLFAVLVVSCAGPRAAESPFEGRDRSVLLTVDNQDFRDATVFSDWNGVRQRVGMVTGKTKQTFTLEWQDYTVRFSVDFVGGGGLPPGDEIMVSPGEHLDFVIMPGW